VHLFADRQFIFNVKELNIFYSSNLLLVKFLKNHGGGIKKEDKGEKLILSALMVIFGLGKF